MMGFALNDYKILKIVKMTRSSTLKIFDKKSVRRVNKKAEFIRAIPRCHLPVKFRFF